VKRGTLRRSIGRLLLLWALAVAAPAGVDAHPMGNVSISHYAAIRIEPGVVHVRYLVDLAEIPTFQALQESPLPLEPHHPAVQAYLARTVETLRDALALEVDGQRLTLEVQSSDLAFPPGAGGLPTLRIGAVYRAATPSAEPATARVLTYRDANYPGRAGWKEIVARAASGARLIESTVPERDRSRELAEYPTDPAESPPQLLEAQVVFASAPALPAVAGLDPALAKRLDGRAPPGPAVRPATATAAAPPREPARATEATPAEPVEPAGVTLPAPEAVDRPEAGPRTPRDPFTALIAGGPLGPAMLLFTLAVAASLGALHALEPGHGKTVVAAYLVGSRGTAGHAFLLGLVVTASHTVGVYLLGAVTLYASRYVVPERLYPWLGALSGILIAVLGVSLLYRRLVTTTARRGHASDHAHGHPGLTPSDHEAAHARGFEHGHDHGHGHHHHHHVPDGPVSLRSLVALGVSGGIVPCPAALVVLLSAVAMGRIGLGFLLIVAFSVGLAAVLIAIGLVVVSARRLAARFGTSGVDGPLVRRWLPLTSAAVITASGVVITIQALGG
jgi:ABC-type nickel/cobalt efflux system permease component RcnA